MSALTREEKDAVAVVEDSLLQAKLTVGKLAQALRWPTFVLTASRTSTVRGYVHYCGPNAAAVHDALSELVRRRNSPCVTLDVYNERGIWRAQTRYTLEWRALDPLVQEEEDYAPDTPIRYTLEWRPRTQRTGRWRMQTVQEDDAPDTPILSQVWDGPRTPREEWDVVAREER